MREKTLQTFSAISMFWQISYLKRSILSLKYLIVPDNYLPTEHSYATLTYVRITVIQNEPFLVSNPEFNGAISEITQFFKSTNMLITIVRAFPSLEISSRIRRANNLSPISNTHSGKSNTDRTIKEKLVHKTRCVVSHKPKTLFEND